MHIRESLDVPHGRLDSGLVLGQLEKEFRILRGDIERWGLGWGAGGLSGHVV